MLTHARSYLNPLQAGGGGGRRRPFGSARGGRRPFGSALGGRRGGYFLISFSGFAIDRSKKYVKTIRNHIKFDAVDPQAAADNHPPPPGHNGQVYGTLQPPKPRQIVTASWNVDACTILPQPFVGGRRPFGSARGGRRPFGSVWPPTGRLAGEFLRILCL